MIGQAAPTADNRLRELMAVAWEPLLIVDCASRRIVDLNPAACRLYGMGRDDLIGTDFGQRFSEARFVEDIFERHRDYVPLRFQRGAGERHFPVEISVRYFADGEAEHAAIALRDISERIQRDRVDSESERKYQSLFEASPYPILILNPLGMVMDANRCALVAYGYDHDALIGQHWQTLDVSPIAVQFSVRPTLLGAREHRRHDGSTFIAEVMLSYFRLRGLPMILALVRDVTEHWRTFQQLQESEARWRFAIEGSGDSVVEWSVGSGGTFYVSPMLSTLLGYDPVEDAAESFQTWRDRIHPDDLHAVDQTVAAHMASREPLVQVEYRMRQNDGRYRWLALRAKMIPSSVGESRLVGAVRDIHELRSRKLKEMADRTKMFRLERLATAGEMLSALAHEVNQPLTAISNFGALALRQLAQASDPDMPRRSLTVICEQALRAGEIVRRIREFVRRGQLDFRRTDLNELINRVAGWCANDAAAATVQIQLELDSQLGPVDLDILQIEQVLFNLLRNGLEAMSDDDPAHPRRLQVSSQAQGEQVRICVRDHGCGLVPDVAETMFEPFVSSKPEGMGMGLAICRTVIENHGGEIWAETPDDGPGTRFLFTLPRQHRNRPATGDNNGRT